MTIFFNLLPKVVHKLQQAGINPKFLGNFFEQVVKGTFPLVNVAFLLWIEVVEWFQNDCTSGMRYMEETKKFWKLGWRHFGGQFIRFMSGYKNMSQVKSGESGRGLLQRKHSDINFAVQSIDVLRSFSLYGTDKLSDIQERSTMQL